MNTESRLERIADRVLNRLLVLSGGIALVALCVRLAMNWNQVEEISLGEQPTTEVINGLRSEPVPLFQVAQGTCRLVIFYWSDCPHCRTLADRWSQSQTKDGPHILPPDWTSIWVARLSSPEESIRLPGAPVIAAWPTVDDVMTKQLGISGFPFFAILDKKGELVARGEGGRLVERDRYKGDCSIQAEIPERVQLRRK